MRSLVNGEQRIAPTAPRLLRDGIEASSTPDIIAHILDTMAEGVIAVSTRGMPILFNAAARRILRMDPAVIPPDQWPAFYGCYLPDTVTPYPADQLPIVCAMRGESVDDAEIFIRHEKIPEGVWIRSNARPIRNGRADLIGGLTVFRDITTDKQAEHALRESREQLREFATRLACVREEECARMAREIHDRLGHRLTAVKLSLAHSLKLVRNSCDQCDLSTELNAIMAMVDESIHGVRHISSELRPPVLDLGIAEAIEWRAGEFASQTGIRSRSDRQPSDLELPASASATIFRIYEEILTNIARHAQAAAVQTSLRKEGDQLVLEVRDDGRGISEADIEDRGSLGILGMKERALMVGGTLEIHGEPGAGTVVTLRVPVSSARHTDSFLSAACDDSYLAG